MYYEANATCLYCDHKFTTTRVRLSKARVTQRDSDFCIHYDGPNPLFYDITVCPNCGFAFYKSYRNIAEHQRKTLEENYINKVNVADLTGERTLTEAKYTYKLAILTAKILKERKFITANLALKLAWLYRFENNEEQEKRFLQIALDDYIYMMANENIEQEEVNEDRLIYLMADLYSRLDYYVEARKLFSQLMTDRSISKRYKSLAIDRWNEYKDQVEES